MGRSRILESSSPPLGGSLPRRTIQGQSKWLLCNRQWLSSQEPVAALGEELPSRLVRMAALFM